MDITHAESATKLLPFQRSTSNNNLPIASLMQHNDLVRNYLLLFKFAFQRYVLFIFYVKIIL